MPEIEARRQKAVARNRESQDERITVDRAAINARAETAFYSVAQTFLSEFETAEPDLYPTGTDTHPRGEA